MAPTKAPTFSLVSGYSRARLAPIDCISALACDSATPGRRRAITIQLCRPLSVHCRAVYVLPNGAQMCPVTPLYSAGGSLPGASTPIIVCFSSLSVTVRPTASGAASKRVRQNASLITTTLGAPARSSCSPKSRPSAGRIRRTRHKLAVTKPPCTTSGVRSPMRRNDRSSSAPRSSKEWLRAFQST